ncbi:SDR family oxidoreductase [Rhodopila sp.]|uniref:SDR family oxidoreductase n=1 Tax=Rhodopila sp. TaxID=2480087 RepID=UPI003D0D4AD9
MRGLTGRGVLLTGGASGIGRATAVRLAQQGCRVGILDIDEAGAAATVAACPNGAWYAATDITDRAAVETAVARFEAEVAPVDLLANVAGWERFSNFLDTDIALWDRIIGINLYGPMHLHHVVLPGMVRRGFGRVVNVASDAGRVGSSGEAVYSACKGGIIAFTKTMAREMARFGITLNVVCPGPTDTPLFDEFKSATQDGAKVGAAMARAVPLKRIGQPEDYPGTIAFLLSDDAAFITGQTLSVSGGLTMS